MKTIDLLMAFALLLSLRTEATTKDDEKAIRAINDIFIEGLLKKDPKLRASVWLEDGTLLPPNAGFLAGRKEIEKHFQTEVSSITQDTKAAFSNYRFRFITPDAAFVDTDLTINNVMGPDGKVLDAAHVSVAFTAVRRNGKWFIQDERTRFEMAPPK